MISKYAIRFIVLTTIILGLPTVFVFASGEKVLSPRGVSPDWWSGMKISSAEDYAGADRRKASLYLGSGASVYETRTIAKSSQFGSIDGLEFDQSNQLWMCNFFTNKVLKLDRSGAVLETYDASNGVSACSDLTIGPDNLVYFLEFLSGHVKRINADHTITSLASLPPGLEGIGFDHTGRLFVSDFAPGSHDQIWEVDPTGVNSPVLKVVNAGNINQFTIGPDNLLYGPQTFGDAVERINVDTGEITVVADGFTSPIVNKFDRQNILHVMDAGADQIVQVDITNGNKTVLADGITEGADALTFDLDNRLYFGSAVTGLLARLSPNATIIPLSKEGLVSPGGIAVVPNNAGKDEVWVADFFSIAKYDGTSGRSLSFFPGSAPAQFMDPGIGFPSNITQTGNDTFILTSFFLGQVRKWNFKTNATTFYGPFNAPVAAVPFQDDIAVVELGSGSIVRASDHTVIAAGLILPTGIASNGQDLYVAEWATGMIKKIAANGQTLTNPVIIASGLQGPEGLCFDQNGDGLLVVEVASRSLSRVDLATGSRTILTTGLEIGETAPVVGAPPTGLTLSTPSVGSNGVIYITGDAGRIIYRLTPLAD